MLLYVILSVFCLSDSCISFCNLILPVLTVVRQVLSGSFEFRSKKLACTRNKFVSCSILVACLSDLLSRYRLLNAPGRHMRSGSVHPHRVDKAICRNLSPVLRFPRFFLSKTLIEVLPLISLECSALLRFLRVRRTKSIGDIPTLSFSPRCTSDLNFALLKDR